MYSGKIAVPPGGGELVYNFLQNNSTTALTNEI
jgi:hypothetical protein